MHRALLMSALVLTLGLGLVGSGAATSTATGTAEDALGDSKGGAADIRRASISDDGRGLLTFSFDLADRTELSTDDLVQIFVDSDADPATGKEGDDYVIEADPADRTIGMWRWDGTRWASTPNNTLATRNGLQIAVHTSELGRTAALVAYFQTARHSDREAYDSAGPVRWSGVATPSGEPRLTLSSFKLVPARPVAGKQLLAHIVVHRGDTGALLSRGDVRCSATIGGKPVKTTWPGHFFTVIGLGPLQASAVCSWNVPKSARGKTIKGTITVVADGLTATRSFSARIR